MTDNSLDRMLLLDKYFELGKMERNVMWGRETFCFIFQVRKERGIEY